MPLNEAIAWITLYSKNKITPYTGNGNGNQIVIVTGILEATTLHILFLFPGIKTVMIISFCCLFSHMEKI